MFQFTHPGGVRHHSLSLGNLCRDVSIHAPGRGATGLVSPLNHRLGVSIHAPGRGATDALQYSALGEGFQFTHPGGVRLPNAYTQDFRTLVSIHAPGRGATER